MLRDIIALSYDSEIYDRGTMTNTTVILQMSADLYHKLESPGCLPQENKRIESLLYSYGQSYHGFNLLLQIIMPHCPALQSSSRPIQPTWDGCEENLYTIQVLLQMYYSAEKTTGRLYSPAQQSINFLNEFMKSSTYAALAKICKQKIINNGLEKIPP